MSLLQAIILGIVQGLTEFIPISSTAHLRIVPALLGWDDPGAAFTAVVQWGTLAAVLLYFRRDIVRIAQATLGDVVQLRFSGSLDARQGWMILVGSLPIVVFGLMFDDSIETTLRSLYVIAGSMLLLALGLALAELFGLLRKQRGVPSKGLAELGWRDAIAVGFAQALALIPGSSRSGVTIMGGLFCGMDRQAAARFSFLLSLPSVLAAGVYELVRDHEHLLASAQDATALVLATVVAGIVGYASIAFLLGYLKAHSTWPFIAYRLIMGGLLLYWLGTGKLAAF